MKIEFLDEAKLEIRAGRERYNAERPALGRAFILEVRAVIHQIGAGPLHFQKVARSRARRAFLTQFPYKIVYFALPDMILIVAIAHQHQRPNYWRSRT